ncbi:hypothetical protein BaRGS_00023406, partial [Batillaria attramentaria]
WAKLLLLYVCVLACLLIGPSLSLRDNEETKFDKRLIGGERLCYISGDPHLHGFGRASADVDLPCRFRATRFVTQNVRGTPGHASCGIEVYATNELLDGRYVVRSVHISVGVSDHALLHHSAFEVYKTFNYNVNDSTIYNYQTRIISRDNIWGSSRGVVDGIVIEPTYDEENNFAMLEIPHCETRIKYRAFDPARPKHQRQLPGVTIQAPRHAAFHGGDAMSFYPQSACGTPADGRLLYRNRAEELGLVDDETAIIYDILTEKPAQNPRWRAVWVPRECARSTSSTVVCSNGNKKFGWLPADPVSFRLHEQNLSPSEGDRTRYTFCVGCKSGDDFGDTVQRLRRISPLPAFQFVFFFTDYFEG